MTYDGLNVGGDTRTLCTEVNLGADYSNQVLVRGQRTYDLTGRVSFCGRSVPVYADLRQRLRDHVVPCAASATSASNFRSAQYST
jgi:hypothetical protein